MIRPFRAPGLVRWTLAAAVFCAAAASAGSRALAQSAAAKDAGGLDDGRRVKVFDFDERRRGNYEDTPMHWQRLTGDGLPAYSSGRLDSKIGHEAGPSFVLTLKGGNIGYEYTQPDLVVAPNSDYLVEAYVRAEGLEYAQSLVVCYLTGEAGERIAGSECASQAVRCEPGGQDTGWQRVEIPVHVGPSGPCKLRLQLWVVQDYVLHEPEAAVPDPIIRQEVDAQVWFDDISIVRVPRLALGFSNPGGIVKPGAAEALRLDMNNATLGVLTAEVAVLDESGKKSLERSVDLAPRAAEQLNVPLPPLPPGLYRAEAHLRAEDGAVVGRTIRFVILPDLQRAAVRSPDIGVDLGRQSVGDPEGAAELITNLGCGAIKLGLPTVGVPQTSEETERLRQVRDLLRRLTLSQVEATGVILSPGWGQASQRLSSTYRMITTDEAWAERVGPALACLGGHLASWQLGSEPVELRETPGWDTSGIERIRHALERFAAVPLLVVPRSIFDDAPAAALLGRSPGTRESAEPGGDATAAESAALGTHACSFWLPAELPARAFPWHLATWFGPSAERSQGTPPRWLSLGLERNANLPADNRLTDRARRIVLACAANPERVYVPAPFELVTTGGDTAWQPTEEYIPLRTLLHCLSGRRVTAALSLPHETIGLLFSQGQRDTLVIWTWQEDACGATVELCLGPQASVIELNGQKRRLQSDGPRARVPLSATPLIIEDVNAALLLFEQSVRVEPAFIQVSEPEPRPVLTLRNTYRAEIAGTINLLPPANWNVGTDPIQLQLGPGETLSETLKFDIPPRQLAAEQVLGVDVHLARPETVDLHFDVPLRVGLKDIVIQSSAHWDRDDLVVEQSLQNLSASPVSFNSFCQPPQRAQLEGVLLNVKPGDTARQVYRIPAARDLAGGRVWVGAQEIGGHRTLDQLVLIPR